MNPFIFQLLGSAVPISLLGCLLGPIARRANLSLQKYHANEPLSNQPRDIEPTVFEADGPAHQPRNLEQDLSEEGPYHYLKRLINTGGLLGILFLPLGALAIVFNTDVLAGAFEIIWDRAGTPWTEFTLAGQRYALTDLHLYAGTVALGLVLIGVAHAHAIEHSRRFFAWFIALFAILPLWALELGASATRGYLLAADTGRDPLYLAGLNALQAHIAVTVEILCGYFAIHLFLIVLAQAFLWAVIAPLRNLFRPSSSHSASSHGRPRAPLLVKAGSVIDEGIFEPLRDLDKRVGRRITGPHKEELD